MASVHTKGTDTWQANIRVWIAEKGDPAKGAWRRTWRTTGIPATAPKTEAEMVAEAIQNAALAVGPQNPRRADQRTFVDALEAIWKAAGVAPPQVSSSWRQFSQDFLELGDRTPRTQATYKSQVKIFTDWLGKKADDLLWNLGHGDFQGFYKFLLEGGRAEKRARNHVVMLQSVMERAFLMGIISRNPAKLVDAPAGHSAQRIPFTSEEITAVHALLDAPPRGWPVLAPPRPEEWRTSMLLGLCCGMRLGDATGRAWKDFDLSIGTVSLVPEKKAKKGRVITLPLAPPLLQHLRALKQRDVWLTPTLREKRSNSLHFSEIVSRAGIISQTNREARIDAGRTIRLKTFHSLRHTLNTMLAAAGTEKQLRMLISDHDDPRVSDRYTHATVERLAGELAKIFPSAR